MKYILNEVLHTMNNPTMIIALIINYQYHNLYSFCTHLHSSLFQNNFFNVHKLCEAMFVWQVCLAQRDHVFLLFSICVCRDLPPGKVWVHSTSKRRSNFLLFIQAKSQYEFCVWGEGDSSALQTKFCTNSTYSSGLL